MVKFKSLMKRKVRIKIVKYDLPIFEFPIFRSKRM